MAGEMKKCLRCQHILPLSEFHKNAARYDGRQQECKECGKRRKAQEYGTQAGKARCLTHQRKYKYGLTADQVSEMFRRQNGSCALCKKEFGDLRIHIDHDHATGRVRGILHQNCNLLLGHAKDNIETLEMAISYLRGY